MYLGPFIFQTAADYVPHPMHDIIATLIASGLNMTLNWIWNKYKNRQLQSHLIISIWK